ncbi:MAG: hypothetical protein K8R76_06250 [Candidatus Aegiribacteria sp.]|nr:hypothetical protein [Candidatus Aegiribacteria sp.]
MVEIDESGVPIRGMFIGTDGFFDIESESNRNLDFKPFLTAGTSTILPILVPQRRQLIQKPESRFQGYLWERPQAR